HHRFFRLLWPSDDTGSDTRLHFGDPAESYLGSVLADFADERVPVVSRHVRGNRHHHHDHHTHTAASGHSVGYRSRAFRRHYDHESFGRPYYASHGPEPLCGSPDLGA